MIQRTKYRALCSGCSVGPRDFNMERNRNAWAYGHEQMTGHEVEKTEGPQELSEDEYRKLMES